MKPTAPTAPSPFARLVLFVSALAALTACGASNISPPFREDAAADTPATLGDVPPRGDTPTATRDTGPLPPPPVDGGVFYPCPGSPDGSGLACANVGEGCASSGPCGASASCQCGTDHRWYCRSTAPLCDGGTPDVVGRDTETPPPPPLDAGTPVACPGTLEGNGLPCRSTSPSCGSADRCGGVVNCVCGLDLRWRCMGTGPLCDGGVVDASPVDTGPVPACTFGGTYEATLGGYTVYFRFLPDGTWRGATTPEELGDPATPGGTWSLSGRTFFIRDGASVGSCGDATGTYALSFDEPCNALLSAVSDECAGRREALDGITLVRR